jgi:hypothetical protein
MRKLGEEKEPLGGRIRGGWKKTERMAHQIAKNAKIGEDEPIAGGPGGAEEARGPGGAEGAEGEGGEGGEGGLAGGAGGEGEEGRAGGGGEAGEAGGGGGRQAQGQGSRRISDSPRE